MANTVLIGYDGSDSSRDALTLGARLAREWGADVELVCAYPHEPRPTRVGDSGGYGRPVRDDARETLRRARTELPDLVVVSRSVPSVSPAHALQSVADEM